MLKNDATFWGNFLPQNRAVIMIIIILFFLKVINWFVHCNSMAGQIQSPPLRGRSQHDGQWRQAERRAGHRNFSRNPEDGSSN